MRCFFNLVDGDRIIPDQKGVVVTDVEDARREALLAIEDLRSEPGSTSSWNGWQLEAIGEGGLRLFTIVLDDVHVRSA